MNELLGFTPADRLKAGFWNATISLSSSLKLRWQIALEAGQGCERLFVSGNCFSKVYG